MRNLNIFLLVLIHGIVSAAIADGETSNSNETAVPEHVSILGFVNTTVEDIEKFDIELCEKNGGPGSYQEHVKSRKEYERCTTSLRAEIIGDLVISEHTSIKETEIVYYNSYCKRITGFENCIKNLTISMKTCLDTSKHESADILYNTISALMRFLCDNEGNQIKKFITADGDSCIESKSHDVINCFNQTLLKYVQSEISDGASLGGLGKLHLLVPDLKKCTIFERFRVCTVDVLKSCVQPVPDLLDSMFNLAKKTTTCDRLLSKSKASPASVVNHLLVSTVMAVSLRFS